MRRAKSKRDYRGSAIAEFAPAITVLLLVVFLPLLDLMPILVGYAGCWYLNSQQSDLAAQSLLARGNAFTNQGDVQTQLDTLASDWKNSALGNLAKLQDATTTITGPVNSSVSGGYLTCYVQVTTQVKCAPFVQLSFVGPVPGIGAPINVSISSQRVVEDATQ